LGTNFEQLQPNRLTLRLSHFHPLQPEPPQTGPSKAPVRGPGSIPAEIYSKDPVFGFLGVRNRLKPSVED
jgi:hypothetical protein